MAPRTRRQTTRGAGLQTTSISLPAACLQEIVHHVDHRGTLLRLRSVSKTLAPSATKRAFHSLRFTFCKADVKRLKEFSKRGTRIWPHVQTIILEQTSAQNTDTAWAPPEDEEDVPWEEWGGNEEIRLGILDSLVGIYPKLAHLTALHILYSPGEEAYTMNENMNGDVQLQNSMWSTLSSLAELGRGRLEEVRLINVLPLPGSDEMAEATDGILELFSAVRRLHLSTYAEFPLRDAQLSWWESEAVPVLIAGLTSVTHLTLSSAPFGPFPDLAEHHFPSLRHLRLEDMVFASDSLPPFLVRHSTLADLAFVRCLMVKQSSWSSLIESIQTALGGLLAVDIVAAGGERFCYVDLDGESFQPETAPDTERLAKDRRAWERLHAVVRQRTGVPP